MIAIRTAVGLMFAIGGTIASADAQSYNPEDRWIGRTIRKSENDRWERQHKRAIERPYPIRHGHRNRRRHAADRDPGNSASRVYGMTIRRLDTTGSVTCYPQVEAYSVEANTENGAWSDAQRNWENQVRAMVGERWMEVANSRDVTKQCWASSGNQSVAGRVSEKIGGIVQSVTGNDGGVDGRKHRCRILARPCQAPIETGPMVKGETP